MYIFLKHLTWEFQIHYLFREILKFRDFIDNNMFRWNNKRVHKIAKFKT